MAEYIEFEATKQAIDRIRSVYHRARNFNAVSVIDNVFGEIKETPAADVAPVAHGRMKKSGEFTVERYQYKIVEEKCSVCEHYSIRFKHKSESNFCSHCGAKMDGLSNG